MKEKNMFTELEKKILDATDPEYKYIFLTSGGNLYVSSDASGNMYKSMNAFGHLFKDVKKGADPICFRKPILDDTEREYLKAVFKPFHQHIRYVKKVKHNEGSLEYIKAAVNDDGMTFPDFKAGEMYTGMELDKEYHLDDLGITYD